MSSTTAPLVAFGEFYRELMGLDPATDLMDRSAYMSPWESKFIPAPTLEETGLDPPQLMKLYYFMVLARLLDEEIKLFRNKGKMKGKHLSKKGNEATAVGASYALKGDEWFSPAVRDLGAFLVRGITPYEHLCQALGKKNSPTKGTDGSLHLGSPERKIIGLISPLAVPVPVVTGCAYGKKYHGKKGASLAFIGDGATSLGVFHEGLRMATNLEIPLVVVIENNQWAFGTPRELQCKSPSLALQALAYGPKAEGIMIDGTQILTVYKTVKDALERARNDNKTILIESITMRMEGHSLADPFKYVPKDQLEIWAAKDPIGNNKNFLIKRGIFTTRELEETEKRAKSEIKEAAIRAEKCDPSEATNMEARVFVPTPKHENVLINPPSDGRRLTYKQAISEALRNEMRANPDMYQIGEDIAHSGGPFLVTQGFSEEFDGNKRPESYKGLKLITQKRMIDAALAESGFTAFAAGSTYEGLKPVIEYQFGDFSLSAFMIITQFIANQTFRNLGPMPVVMRMPSGWGEGASGFHSGNPESWFGSIPGLKIVAPTTSFDAKGLLNAAMRDGNPVIYIEYKDYYTLTSEILTSEKWQADELNTPVPEEDYIIPIGKARILREGKDLTVVTYGSQVFRALKAAKLVEKDTGMSIEVIDLRTILPWDKKCVSESVRKTNRILVTCEAQRTGCFGNSIFTDIVDSDDFEHLDARPKLLASADTFVPYAHELENAHLPIVPKLAQIMKDALKY